MAQLHKSVAAIRIFGDSLIPDEISKILGCAPTRSYIKGQVEPSKTKPIVRKTGAWQIKTDRQKPGNLDDQIIKLLGRLNKDLTVWTALSAKYEIDLFCGCFMNETDEGIELSSETLKALGDRDIKLGLCIYAPIEADKSLT
jgi:hypothetical protein